VEVIALGALVFGLAYAFTHRGGNRTTTDNWQPAQISATLGEVAGAGDVRYGTQRAAAVQLGRIEARHLLRNETFIVGVFMSIAIVVVFGVIWASDNLGSQNSWRFWMAILPAFTLPFAGLTLVAVNLAALRSRRDGAEELLGSLPATDTARVVGHLGSMWTALAVQAVFVAATIINGKFVNHRFGVIDAASIGDVAVSFVLVVCASSLAVALARWLPHPIVALGALVAIGIGGSAIGGIGTEHWSLTRQLSIWPRYPDHDWAFAVRPTWWHAIYLLALGALVAVAAVARTRRDRPVAILAALIAVIAAVAGFVQTRPMSDGDADRIAATIADPIAHSTCSTHDGLVLCAYRDYADITDVWADELTAPFAAVSPQRRSDGFTVVWRELHLDRLDPAVRRRIDADALTATWEADPATWNGVTIDGTESVPVNRLALGLWSAGLPLIATPEGTPCAVGGQARGVVALWVAAQGKTVGWARRLVTGSWSGVRNPDNGYPVPASWIDGYVWVGDRTPPVLWSATDIAAAEALVGLEAATVRDTLWSDWPHWIDATTTTDELMTALGLAPVGTPDGTPEGTLACQ
jgi:hypothetical protein